MSAETCLPTNSKTRVQAMTDPTSALTKQLLQWISDKPRTYAEAWKHFRSIIETDPRVGDNDYGMAGVAKWCLGEPQEAVSQWRAGLKAEYARSGVTVRMGLLLYFVSVVRPEVFDQDEAKRLLLEKADDPRIRDWPGPIAKLILRQISEVSFKKAVKAKTQVKRAYVFGLRN